jgi:hypothetical protein
VPWAASVVAAIPFGFGMVLIFLSIMNYLIDSYTIFAASVLAGNGIIRSVFGAAFPLFTSQMYNKLGIHWASSVPGFLAIACLPLPFLFYKYGKTIREKCTYAAQSEAFMERIRNQASAREARQQAGSDSEGTSRAATLTPQEEVEQEAHVQESAPKFEEMKAEKEIEDEGLKKVQTGRSTRSRRSVRGEDYNPYDLNRVATRESFVGRPRGNSRASSKR